MRRDLALRRLLGSLLLGAILVNDSLAVSIGPGFTGAWYDPAQSGHGLFVEVLNNNGFLAWWFTFNPAGTQQSWFGGVGTYSGNTATITQVIQTTGGRWIPNFDPTKLTQVAWGSLTFTFTDCSNGRVDFNAPVAGYGVGSMTLSRLTLPDGLTCSDSGSGASAAEGVWSGTTSANETALAIVLSDGTYYLLYSQPGDPATEGGVFQGTASTANGQFVSSDSKDFPIAHDIETFQTAKSASVGGSYVPGASLQLSLTGRTGSRTLTAAYVAGSGQGPSVAALAGSYTGFTGHASGERDASFTIDASGNLSGSNAAQCSYAGTLAPRTEVKAFDFTLRSVGDPAACIFGLGPISGIAYYDEASRQIHAFAPYASRNDQYYVIGTKQ